MEVGVVFCQLVMLAAMILCGMLCQRRGWVPPQSYKNISSLVVNVFNPLLIIGSVVGKDVAGAGSLLGQNLVLVVLLFAVVCPLAPLMGRALRAPQEQRAPYGLMLAFSNLGFMGIPLVTALYSSAEVLFVAFYILVYNVLIYTYGLWLAGAKGGASGLKRMLNPGTLSSLVAILLFALHLQLPDFVVTFLNYMGNAAVPLSMMMIGVNLAGQDLRAIAADWRLYVFSLLKMVLLPVAVVLVVRAQPFFAFDATLLGIFTLMLGMPVGSMTVLLSEEYGADSAVCSRGVAVTTVLCLVTLPLITLILG